MTGALLTKEGYRVTVLEKNRTFGGGLQSFRRHGHLFDPCMHVFGGMNSDGNLRSILNHLGILDKLRFEPRYDTIIHDGDVVRLPFGRDAWIEAIGGGSHKEELNTYVDALYSLVDTEDLFCMRPSTGIPREAENISAKELIARHIGYTRLRNRLSYVSHLYDGTDDSPALLHALTNVLHIDGIYTLAPSASTMADALAGIITAGGGMIHTSCEVTAIEADGKRATAVVCGAQRFTGDHYISDIAIGALMRIAPQQAFSTAFRRRAAEFHQCCSAFCIYGILKPHTVAFENKGYHVLSHDASPWNMSNTTQQQWPNNLFLLTYPDASDPRYAATFTLVAPMDYRFVRQWEGSTLGHRPDDYRLWKQQMAAQALRLAEDALGPFETEFIDTASPLTIRDYNGTTEGSCYGLHSSTLNPAFTTLSTRTRLENLFLTGQDVNFHGMVGTSLTAVLTAETIVGRNVIVNQIINERK